MSQMCRTQIYLDPELTAALDRFARKRGISRAEVIRLAARRFLEQEGADDEDPILGLIGLGSGEAGRVSEEHDRVLAEIALHTGRQ